MPEAPADLPDDPALLKQMVAQLLASLGEKQRHIDGLQERLDRLLRRLYGPRSERIDPNQLLLFEGSPTPPQSPPPAGPPPRPRRRGHGRKPLPKDLPRRRVV